VSRRLGSRPHWLTADACRCWCLVLIVVLIALTGLTATTGVAQGQAVYSSQKLSFSVGFNDAINPHRVLGVFIMPGDVLPLEVVRGRNGEFQLQDAAGRTELTGKARWAWTAPARGGLYPLKITRLDTREVMTLNVFVLTPRDPRGQERIGNYRMGAYPSEPLRGLDVYKPPRGFVQVTRANAGTLVSPHFTLGQFASKQSTDFPKYLILRERMLLMLEEILEAVNEEGIPARTLQIMSGYRTPWYNARIGNSQYSRHVYGGAADIYIDERAPRGRMDDLNGDGRSDMADARVLAAIVERVQNRPGPMSYVGGIGLYGPKPHRGPFVHADVRGFEARWEFE